MSATVSIGHPLHISGRVQDGGEVIDVAVVVTATGVVMVEAGVVDDGVATSTAQPAMAKAASRHPIRVPKSGWSLVWFVPCPVLPPPGNLL